MDAGFIKGIIPPILTPIDEHERIDEAKLRDQVEFVIQGGVHGILAFGSNSEFYMVDPEESERGLKIILDQAAGRIPIFYGIGEIKTSSCIKLAEMAAKHGVAAVSVLQPMFITPKANELAAHFTDIAKAIPDTPMLLYNNPGRVGYTITAALVADLAEKVDNIVGIKDTSGDMTLTAEMIRLTRGRDFKVMGGRDTLLYATLAHGGVGGVVTMANLFPELVCSIYEKYVQGDIAGSLEDQYRLNPVRLSMDAATFPVAAKDMARLIGRDMGVPFKPTLPSTGEVLEKMRQEIIRAGLMP
ncbi:MAG: dihydrodipicolinate synthase family protein [Oscillospiraceae bacterium]|nr:dihydrodipicolinate synthase family protein [Oscillospiraceae bacterium]